MSEATNAVKLSKNPFDNFLAGARQGFGVWWKFVAPAILMAYVITQFLETTNIMDLFSKYGGPVMMVFGALPGVAMVAFVAGSSARAVETQWPRRSTSAAI